MSLKAIFWSGVIQVATPDLYLGSPSVRACAREVGAGLLVCTLQCSFCIVRPFPFYFACLLSLFEKKGEESEK